VQEGTFQGVSESGLEVEYQVPTSSQRDQEDDPCIVLSSEDEDEDDDEAMPDEGNAEGFENDGIETGYNYEMEHQEIEEGPDIDEIQSSANNEVEIEDLSEVPSSAAIGQSSQASESSTSRQGENQQQIQSISSGTGNGNEAGPSTSGTSSSSLSPATISQWRQSPNASTSRQQAQHLMLMGQAFQDDTGDDRIVPSTPTLYRSRNDGFSEVVSSPHPAQVPHAAARFTFGESSSSSSTSTTTQNRPLAEGMDDTRIDLSEEHGQPSGRSVPNIPQPSPGDNLINDSTSASTSSTSSSMSTVIQQDILEQPVPGSSNQEESQVPEISITTDEGEKCESVAH
jgi:nucleoprotein TPR